MKDLAASLKQNLDQKLSMLDDLGTLLEEEQKAIVRLNLEDMERIDEKKRALLLKLDENGENCRKYIIKASEIGNLPLTSTLSPVITLFSAEVRDEMEKLQQRLLASGKKVDRLLESNRELLMNSLKSVNASLDFFHRMFTLGNTYSDGGRMSQAETGARLLSREA